MSNNAANNYDDVDLSEEELKALQEDDEDNDENAGDQEADNSEDDIKDDAEDKEDLEQDDQEQEDKKDQDDDSNVVDTDNTKDTDKADDDSQEKTDDSKAEDEPEKSIPERQEKSKEDTADKDNQQDTPIDQIAELEEKLKGLKIKFDNGDIELDAYLDERSKTERAIIKEEMAQEFARQKYEDAWKTSQNNFFKGNAYLKENDVLFSSFAVQVNKLLQSQEGANLSNEEVLNRAKNAIDTAFNRQEDNPKQDKSKNKKEKSPADQALQEAKKADADKSKIPQTLRDVPSADVQNETKGKFAYLDKLEGEAFERAIEKLTPAEREAWENEN